ncbi:MAG: PAS domain S-box protein, partial [Myxococcales bacterium]
MEPDYAFFAQMPIPLVLTRAGQVIFTNPAFGEFHGVAPESVIGHSVEQFIAAVADPADTEWLTSIAQRQPPDPIHPAPLWFRARGRGGATTRVCVRTFPLPECDVVVGILVDAEAEL